MLVPTWLVLLFAIPVALGLFALAGIFVILFIHLLKARQDERSDVKDKKSKKGL